MTRDVKAGDDGTIVYGDGGWDTLHCCVCSWVVGKADSLGRKWGWHNGCPIHEGECRARRAAPPSTENPE